MNVGLKEQLLNHLPAYISTLPVRVGYLTMEKQVQQSHLEQMFEAVFQEHQPTSIVAKRRMLAKCWDLIAQLDLGDDELPAYDLAEAFVEKKFENI